MKQILLLLVWVMTGVAAAPPAEKLLPADTLAFLTVPNWSKGGTNFAHSAAGQFWADPAVKAFKEKFLEKFNTDTIQPLEKELGFKFSDYLGLAEGQFTIAVTQNGWDGKSAQQPGLIWIVDTGSNSSQLKTNLTALRQKWTESGRKMRADKIRDIEFTTVIVESEGIGKSLQKLVPVPKAPPTPDDPAAAKKTIEWLIGQSGPLLIVSDAARDVEKVLALQSGASVPALADQAAFAANAPMLREAQTFLWINMKPIMGTLAKRPAPKAEPDNLMGGGFSVEKILTALGLGSVQTLAVNFAQNRDGSLVNFALTVPENARRGLVNILAISPKDASPPPFVPADAVKFSRWRIDLQKGWSTVETMLTEISPAYAGFSKLILDTAGKDKDPNFDFRKQLLANLGDDLITYQKAPRTQTAEDLDAPPQITLVGAKNAEQLAASLKAVASIFPPNLVKYNEREFLGRKVYSFTLPNAGSGKAKALSYAASGGYVAISSDPATLEEYLRSGEGGGKPLREFAGLNPALPRVGGTGNGYFSFENQKETARASFETAKKDPKVLNSLLGLGQLAPLLGGGDGKGLADWFDASLLPPFDSIAKYFYFKVGGLEVAPDAITFKIFTPLPPELRK